MDPTHAHLRAYLTAVGGLPGGELGEDGGVLWCRSPIAWPMFNGVIATPELGPCDGAEAAVAAVAGTGRPWFLWELPDTPGHVVDAATRAGAEPFDMESPWMEARVADLPEPGLPPGVTIEEVSDEAGYRLWAATMREIYEFPEAGEEAWVRQAELCGWTGLPWRQWLAYADGEPAGVTLLYCGGGVAGLIGVGTKESVRRRGIGRLVTLYPLKRSGLDLAGFFATPEGVKLYETLGFRQRGWVSRRLWR